MISPRSISRIAILSASAVLSFSGCGPAGSDAGGSGGHVGSGGGDAPGTGGLSNSGGALGSGGAITPGSGGASSGGMTGTGGGSGGRNATASGGSGSGGSTGAGGTGGGIGGGYGGRGGAATGSGGRGGSATGGSASGGAAGSGVGGTTMIAGKSAGCGTTPTIASGMYNNGQPISISVGGVQRRFILNVPTNYDNSKPYKLIIAWHQLDGNDKQMYANGYYHLLNLSGNNAIFVAPNGEKNNAPCTGTGNSESGCGWPDAGGRNVALGDAVVDLIEKNFCVDTNRIFATGWSYGGSMSYRTACSRPLGGASASWGVRAVAVYSGAQLSGQCTPSVPVAYYHSHGTNDTVLPYDGGATNLDGGGVALAKNFSMANGCTWKTPTKVTSGNHICSDLVGCKTGYPLKWCSFAGPHTPDPKDGTQASSWQYQLVWDFFNQF